MRRTALAAAVLLALGAGAPAPKTQEKPLSRIAFGSCLGQDLPQPIWARVLATRPDLFLFLGDNVYSDTDDPKLLRAAYAKLASQPGFQSRKKSVPILATWDDHDYGTNDSEGDSPARHRVIPRSEPSTGGRLAAVGNVGRRPAFTDEGSRTRFRRWHIESGMSAVLRTTLPTAGGLR